MATENITSLPSIIDDNMDNEIASFLRHVFNEDPNDMNTIPEITPSHVSLTTNYDKADEKDASFLKVDHTYADFSSVDDTQITEKSVILGEYLDAIMNYGEFYIKANMVCCCKSITHCRDFNFTGEAKNETDVAQIGYVSNRNLSTSFPNKLYAMLQRMEIDHIITWLPHGRAFIVRDQHHFMKYIHPRFFAAQATYRSFMRQLNLWGFKRLTAPGPDKGAYYHQLFLRGMPNLIRKMKIQKSKDGIRSVHNPDEEPNFYFLSEARPLPKLIPDLSPLPPLPRHHFESMGYH